MPLSIRVYAMAGNAFRLLLRDPAALSGMVLLVLVILASIIGPELYPYSSQQQNLANRLMPAFSCSLGEGCHVAGTDHLGRDLLSRMLLGARISLIVGFSAVFISGCLGTCLGAMAGYFGGGVDRLISRLADAQLAIPYILLAIAALAVLGPAIRNLILVLGLTGWVEYARLVRASVLTVRETEFVTAARATGASNMRVLYRHVLPNSVDSVLVIASSHLGAMIIAESSLSFLGLGVPPPNPTWGNMLADGRNYLTIAWWLATFPGLALTITILAINLVSDWARDILDPRLRESI